MCSCGRAFVDVLWGGAFVGVQLSMRCVRFACVDLPLYMV